MIESTIVAPLISEFAYGNRSYYWDGLVRRWKFVTSGFSGRSTSTNLKTLGNVHSLLNELARSGAPEEELVSVIEDRALVDLELEPDFPAVIARAWRKAASETFGTPGSTALEPLSTRPLSSPLAHLPKGFLGSLMMKEGLHSSRTKRVLEEFETRFPGLLDIPSKAKALPEPPLYTPQQSLF